MRIPDKKNHYLIAICAITIMGLLLRLKFLPNMGSFWFDEMASITIARFNFPKILEYFVIENNPPLSFIYLHFWIKLFGEKENIVRISSLIPSIVAIPATYLIGKEIFSKKTGLIAALLMSLSFFQIYYSAEARMYPLFQFLALCSIYFFWKILNNEDRKRNWIFYAISSLLLIYTHTFAWTVIFFQIIFLFINRKDHAKIKNKILIIIFFVFIFFLTWFIPKIQTTKFSNMANGWYFQTNSDILSSIIKIFTDLLYERTPYKFTEYHLAVLIILLAISAFLTHEKNKKKLSFNLPKPLLFIFLWIITPLIIFFLFFPSGLSKYVIFTSPALYLLIAQGIINLKLKFQISIPIILFISLVIFSNTFFNIKNDSKIFIWDKVAEYISQEENAEDKIIIHSFVSILEFKQYYKGKTPYEGFYMFENNDEFNKLIIKRNWNTAILEKDYQAVDKKMKIATDGYKRIFLVESNRPAIDPYDLVSKWFFENNWRFVKVEKFEIKNPIIDMRPKIWIWKKI